MGKAKDDYAYLDQLLGLLWLMKCKLCNRILSMLS